MRSRFLSIVLCSLFSFPAIGEEPAKKHPIDVQTEKAEEKALSTADQTQAQADSLRLWDAEMNRVYTKLKKRLKPAAAAALQTAQRDWLKFRDTQRQFVGEMYQEFEGTMFIPMQAAAVKEITRSRALELTRLLETHTEFGE